MTTNERITIAISGLALFWAVFGNAIVSWLKRKKIDVCWSSGSPYSSHIEIEGQTHHDTWVRVEITNNGNRPMMGLIATIESIWIGKERKDWVPCSLTWTHIETSRLSELPIAQSAFLDVCVIHTLKDNPKNTEMILCTSVKPIDKSHRLSHNKAQLRIKIYDCEEQIWTGSLNLTFNRSLDDSGFNYSNEVEIIET